jgi:hypothetical protein
LRFIGIIVVASQKQDFKVRRLSQSGDLMAPPFDGCLERSSGLPFFAIAVVAWFPEGLRAEAIVAAGG